SGQQWYPVFRFGAEGDAFYPAVRSAPDSPPVPAEHHRLHGRRTGREWWHRQRRCQNGDGCGKCTGAALHLDYRGLVWGRELRYVWACVLATPALYVAQRPYLRHGWRTGRRCALYREARAAPQGG